MDKSKFKIEHWKGYGKVYVKRDKFGRIQAWIIASEYEELNIRKLNDSPIIVHPLKGFTTRNRDISRRKKPKTKKQRITIKLSTDLVKLLDFLRGRKAMGTLIEELIREALKQYQTL